MVLGKMHPRVSTVATSPKFLGGALSILLRLNHRVCVYSFKRKRGRKRKWCRKPELKIWRDNERNLLFVCFYVQFGVYFILYYYYYYLIIYLFFSWMKWKPKCTYCAWCMKYYFSFSVLGSQVKGTGKWMSAANQAATTNYFWWHLLLNCRKYFRFKARNYSGMQCALPGVQH